MFFIRIDYSLTYLLLIAGKELDFKLFGIQFAVMITLSGKSKHHYITYFSPALTLHMASSVAGIG